MLMGKFRLSRIRGQSNGVRNRQLLQHSSLTPKHINVYFTQTISRNTCTHNI